MKKLLSSDKKQSLSFSPKVLSQLWLPVVLFLSLILIVIGVVSQQFDTRNRAASHPPAGNAINWETPTVSLHADNFFIQVNGAYYWGNPSTLTLNSDPGTPTYTTLEATWNENGVEMRMFMYLHADSNNWWVDEIRTYNGNNPGDWIYYTGTHFLTPLGQSYTNNGDFVLDSYSTDNQIIGKIYLQNVRVQGFTNWTAPSANLCWTNLMVANGEAQWPCPCCKKPSTEGLECTQQIVNATCEEITQYNTWVANGCQTNQIPNGCGSVSNFQCVPVSPLPARCPTPTQSIAPTSIPTNGQTCTKNKASLTMNKASESTNGEKVNFYATVRNNNSSSCTTSEHITTSVTKPSSGWVATVGEASLQLYAGESKSFPITLTPPADAAVGTYNFTVQVNSSAGANAYTYTVQVVPQSTVTQPANLTHTLEFRVKLRGAPNALYQPFATIRFVNQAKNIDIITQPVGLTPATNGVYRIPLLVSAEDLPSGSGYQIYIKGEKHLSKKFCVDGQTTACGVNQTLSLPAFTGGTTVYDFTGLPLEPGDIPKFDTSSNVFRQDGVINISGDSSDYIRLWMQMNRNCNDTSLTDQERTECRASDLNYNDQIRATDSILLVQSLSERYDD